jgi:F-type H+-transporting ATPase subunit epsilon
MARAFQCDIVSAEQQYFSGSVQSVVVPATEGEMGIYAGHSPLITKLKPGVVRLQMEGATQQGESIYYVSGGFVEVVPDTVTILAENALRGPEIDEAAALEAKRHAEDLMSHSSGDMDYARAASQLAQAIAQLRTLQEIRKALGKG